jgi:hypothetical protein
LPLPIPFPLPLSLFPSHSPPPNISKRGIFSKHIFLQTIFLPPKIWHTPHPIIFRLLDHHPQGPLCATFPHLSIVWEMAAVKKVAQHTLMAKLYMPAKFHPNRPCGLGGIIISQLFFKRHFFLKLTKAYFFLKKLCQTPRPDHFSITGLPPSEASLCHFSTPTCIMGNRSLTKSGLRRCPRRADSNGTPHDPPKLTVWEEMHDTQMDIRTDRQTTYPYPVTKPSSLCSLG